MSGFLGIDTSNYTTSVAYVENGVVTTNLRQILSVKQGERGLRQSDALFAHTVNLPMLFAKMGQKTPEAVGVSVTPRDCEGSYMPCFLAGKSAAGAIASLGGVPLYAFSHQRGHIMAALYSCGRVDLYDEAFVAFHVSGGTTEITLVEEGRITLLGGSEDISCGKAIDRVGVALGLTFPSGRDLERLAMDGKVTRGVRPCVRGLNCNLSGVENQALSMIEGGEKAENVAAFVLTFVEKTLCALTKEVRARYPSLPVLYAGGVMSNALIRPALAVMGESYFAQPDFSCDNAAGLALLGEKEFRKHG